MANTNVLTETNCRACDTVVELRENKNGMAYYYCPMCQHHERYGRDNSEKIKQGLNTDEQNAKPVRPNQSSEPIAESGTTDTNTGIEAKHDTSTSENKPGDWFSELYG